VCTEGCIVPLIFDHLNFEFLLLKLLSPMMELQVSSQLAQPVAAVLPASCVVVGMQALTENFKQQDERVHVTEARGPHRTYTACSQHASNRTAPG
jgi:hypothetical protein